ncbi:helix-turn-helix transcriptional regulator [Methylopila sp. M107]|uniref:helix-turn-helix transcriptional regulator n=1 Tax=Methylopila sp. M107 TaxID=1101190 RepID=UPI00036C0F04|nr:helix-turn-helix transcriptional regulator [Methylopila sp. M107]
MIAIGISSAQELGSFARQRRKALGLRQPDLALSANVGIRFIVDFENGKETCQIGLVLKVLSELGIELKVEAPPSPSFEEDDDYGNDGAHRP